MNALFGNQVDMLLNLKKKKKLLIKYQFDFRTSSDLG